jgi:hypothetical protein
MITIIIILVITPIITVEFMSIQWPVTEVVKSFILVIIIEVKLIKSIEFIIPKVKPIESTMAITLKVIVIMSIMVINFQVLIELLKIPMVILDLKVIIIIPKVKIIIINLVIRTIGQLHLYQLCFSF